MDKPETLTPSPTRPSSLQPGASEKMEQTKACYTIAMADQSGVEIEDTHGAVYVLPYGTMVMASWAPPMGGAKVETLQWMVGAFQFTVLGHRLRRLLTPIREQRLAILKPLPSIARRHAPDSESVITDITVAKPARTDPQPVHFSIGEADSENPVSSDEA